jgi:hypothetical protein
MVFGWSRGYVAFDRITVTKDDDSWTSITYTSNSKDGLHWQAGSELKQAGSSSDDNPTNDKGFTEVVEGPAGLMVVDSGVAPCGSLYEWPFAISRDGVTWTRVHTGIYDEQLTAGAAGYIMTGSEGIFTSTDGSAWQPASLKSAAFRGFGVIRSGAAFADGFVVSGTTTSEVGCTDTQTFTTPALWWSADGKNWTRDVVLDAPTASDVPMSVCRFDDHLLIAGASTSEGAIEWVSTDGRNWERRVAPQVTLCPQYQYHEIILTNEGRTLILSDSDADHTTMYALGEDLTLIKLAQTGDVPASNGGSGAVFGPAGLITDGFDGNTYIGVPFAG